MRDVKRGAVLVLCMLTLSFATQSASDLLGGSQVSARMQRDELALRGLLQQWIRALLENDTEFRGRIMAQGFTLTTYDGRVITREQILEFAKSPDYRIVKVVPEEILIRSYGKEAAVLNGRVQLTEQIGTRTVSNKIQVTQFWFKQRGEWHAVAEHATRIVQ